MLWQKSRRSDNVVEDAGGGGGGGGFGGGRGLGLGGIILVVIVSLIFHKNPLEILQLIGRRIQACDVFDLILLRVLKNIATER